MNKIFEGSEQAWDPEHKDQYLLVESSVVCKHGL